MELNYLLIFYSQLLKRVPVVLCLGALKGPREGKTCLILDYFAESTVCFVSGSQYLKRVLFVLCLGALTGRRGVLSEFLLYHV